MSRQQQQTDEVSRELISKIRKLILKLRRSGQDILEVKYMIGKEITKEHPIELDAEGRIKYGQVAELVAHIAKATDYSPQEIYHCLRFGLKFRSFNQFLSALEERVETEIENLSPGGDKSQLEEEMRTWHWVKGNMLYKAAEKEHVEFEASLDPDTLESKCKLAHRDGEPCTGEIVEVEVCGGHWGAVQGLFKKTFAVTSSQ